MAEAIFHLNGGNENEYASMKSFHVVFSDYQQAVTAWNDNINDWPDLILSDHEGVIIRQLSMFTNK